MKKDYFEPEFEVKRFNFESVLQFYSDPADQGSGGDDPENDPFA